MPWIQIVGTVAALFGLSLLILPAIRVRQGHLPVRRALGLWIAGVGFILIALAALLFTGVTANGVVLVGAALTVVGNLLQRRAPRTG